MKYLKYFENKKNNFFNNEITTLKGLNISYNVNGDFKCSYNFLTSLEYGPKTVRGDFDCSNNELTSLDFLPKNFNGNIYCSGNNWTKPIPFEFVEKYNILKNTLYNNKQLIKFGKYEYQKEFLTETPEKYKDLEPIGYNERIKEEFDWLFNAADMGLM